MRISSWQNASRLLAWATGVSLVATVLSSAGPGTASASGLAWRPHHLAGYRLVMLGSLGGQASGAAAINHRDDVIGFSDTAASQIHAYLWRQGQMTDLGTLGGDFTVALSVNDRDQVAGTSDLPGYVPHAFIWQRGRMTDLGTLGPADSASSAWAVNDQGQVTGVSENTSTDVQRGFLWQRGRMTALGVDAPQDINDQGEIVGRTTVSTSSGNVTRAFMWRHGHITYLAQLPGLTFSDATLINQRGLVAGYTGTDINTIAVVWEHGRIIDLGSLGNTNSTVPVALNDLGQVLVHSGKGYFLWQDGRMTDLATLGIPTSADAAVTGINDRGEIVGSVADSTGFPHAALWVPIYR